MHHSSKPFFHSVLAAGALALLTAACSSGSSSSASNGDGGGGGSGGACKVYDACAVLTAADVSTALGGTFGAGAEGMNHDATSGTVELKNCDYQGATGSPSANVMVRCSTYGDNDPASVKSSLQSLYKSGVETVTGVGDTALWAFDPTLGGQLNVFIGQDLYLIIGVVPASKGSLTTDAALTAAKQLASSAIARL